MKKYMVAIIVLAMCFSLCACGGSGTGGEGESEKVTVFETENMTIHHICVDDSYVDTENSSLKMVYLFYTVNATEENLDADSKYTYMTINESNEYESTHSPSECKFVPSFYYSSYIEEVYVGQSLQVVATFEIPEGDLGAGKTVTLRDSQIPGVEEIFFKTDDIKHFASAEEIASTADPTGYAEEMNARAQADGQRTSYVKSQMDGYYWEFYVNSTSYEIEFFSNNTYELRTRFGTTNGSYVVANGYVICTNASTGAVNYLPYTIENNELKLDPATGFDVFG